MRHVTLKAEFDEIAVADRVRQQLVERGYAVMPIATRFGVPVLTVWTAAVLAPEVEGLVWLAGGSIERRAGSTVRRAVRPLIG